MIIKAAQNPNAGALCKHLSRLDHNERVEVAQLRGVLATDLRGSLAEMEALAAGTRCEKHFYHISVAIQDREKLEREQWLGVVDRIAKEYGMEGHARAVVFHVKDDKEHMHIVYSRINPDTMKAAHLSHDYRRNARLARELEQELGLNPVKSRRTDEREQQRPARDWEDEASRRLLTNPREHRDALADCYRSSDNGQAFVIAIKECGFDLYAGDRRGFLAVDRESGVFYAVDKRLTGDSASQVREKLADLPPLPPLPPSKGREQRVQSERAKGGRTDKGSTALAPDDAAPAEPKKAELNDKQREQQRRKEWREFYKVQAKEVFALDKKQAEEVKDKIKDLDQQILKERKADPRANWFMRVGFKLIGRDLDAERDARDQQRIKQRLEKVEFLKSHQLAEKQKLAEAQARAREALVQELKKMDLERRREADKAAGIVRAMSHSDLGKIKDKGNSR